MKKNKLGKVLALGAAAYAIKAIADKNNEETALNNIFAGVTNLNETISEEDKYDLFNEIKANPKILAYLSQRTTETSNVSNSIAFGEDVLIYYTVTQLKAQTANPSLVYVTDKGKQGFFSLDSADITSPDNVGTILVTNTGKRYKRIYDREELEFSWFGAKPEDGTYFDNAPILAGIINYMNQTTASRQSLKFSGKYYFGAVGTTMPTITAPNVTFYCETKGSALLQTQTGTLFHFGNPTTTQVGGGIENLEFFSFTNDTINPVVYLENSARHKFENILAYNSGTFLKAGNISTNAYDITWSNNQIVPANIGASTVKLVSGAGFFCVGKNSIHSIEPTVPAMNNTSVMNCVPGLIAFDFVGNWDTFDSGNLLVEKMYNAVRIGKTLGTSPFFQLRFVGCVFDYIRKEALLLDNPNNSVINLLTIENNYMNSWESDAIAIKSVSTVRNLTVSGNKIIWAGKNGILIDAPLLTEFSLTENKVQSCGRVDAAGSSNIKILDGSSQGIVSKNITKKIDTLSGETWAGAASGVNVVGTSHGTLINSENITF